MYSKRIALETSAWLAKSGSLVQLNPLIDALGGVIDWPEDTEGKVWGWSEQALRLIDYGLTRPDVLHTALSQFGGSVEDDSVLPEAAAFKAEVLIELLDRLASDPELSICGVTGPVEVTGTPSQLAVAYALRLLDENAEKAKEALLGAVAAASILLVEAGFLRGKDAEREEERRLRVKGGKIRASRRKPNPEREVAQAMAKRSPSLSAVQIKGRAKLKASERTIRTWISAVR